ncbi:MAG: ISAs1 family transposase [Holosporales bacterium]|jgi:hypothetical protein|nr:ISAs1 family transposase [Holosporales bacterium]
MKKTGLEGFIDSFSSLKDPRSSKNQLHKVSEILLVTLCACICGAEGWQDVVDYGNSQVDLLMTILPYKNGIPSDDTYRRFFRALDPQEFQKLFQEWIKKLQLQT